MKPSGELHELIGTLTPSEKRYFKIFASRHTQKGKNNYMRVFELMEKQAQYDEPALIAGLADPKLKKQLPVIKNYLHKLILKSLRNYHGAQSVDFRLKEMLMNVEILLRKDLVKQCLKVLGKAKKIALEYEKYEYLLEIGAYNISLAVKVGTGNLDKLDQLMEDIFAETHQYFEQYRNIQAYKKQAMHLLVLNRREKQVRSEATKALYNRIIESPLMADLGKARSVKAASYHHMGHFIYHFALGNYGESFRIAEAMVQLQEDNPRIIEERPENYVNSLQNLVMVSTLCQPLDVTRGLIDRMKNFADRFPQVDFGKATHRKMPMYAYNLELHLLVEAGDFDVAAALTPDITAMLEKNNIRYNVNEGYVLLDLYFKMARIHLQTGDYDTAIHFVNRILNEQEINSEYEVYLNARILQVVILFEAGEFRQLEYALISLYRYLRKRKKLFRFEKALIRFIQKSTGVPSGTSLHPHFLHLRNELNQIMEDPDETIALEHFDFLNWLNSKVA